MALLTARGADEAERRESRLVTAVVAEGFVNRLGFGIVTFALPLYALELGMGIAEIGLLVSAKALLQPAVKPLVGIAVDRWGTRRSYLASVGFRFLAALALLLSTTPAALFGVRLLQGLASAAGDPVSISVLAKGRSDRVSRRFSHVYAARDVGKVSAGLVGGLVLAATGSFPALWVVVVALAAVPLVIVWSFVHELPDRPEHQPVEQDLPDEVERILRSPRLRTIAMLGLFGGLTATMTHALFQVYAAEVAGLDNGQIGLVYSVAVGALLVVGPLAGWVGDRHGHGPLASVRAVSNVVSSVVLLVFPTFAGVLLGRLVDEGGKAAFRPTWGALLAQSARRARGRGGRTAAGLDAWLSLGEALGPLVAGLIWDLAGVVWFLVVRALLGVGTALVLGRRLRVLLREPDEVPAARAVLVAGPGVVELRGVAVGGGDPVDLVVRPGGREVLPAGVSGAPLVQVLLAGGRPSAGTALLDGQDLSQLAPGAGPRTAALLGPAVPEGGATAEQVLRTAWPHATPEDLALAWRRAGLTAVAPLVGGLSRSVAELGQAGRARLALAAALLGEPAVLVVDEAALTEAPAVRDLLPEVLERWPGAVLTVSPSASPHPSPAAVPA